MKRVLFILGQLSDSDIEWLIENGNRSFVRRGEYLVRQGEAIENIYIILDGNFRIFNEDNSAYDIAQIGSGEVIGEMSFLDDRPPSVSVLATEDAMVYEISLDLVKRYMEVNTRFAARFYYALAMFLSDRLRKTTSRLGYGEPVTDDSADEININLLSTVGQAGARFSRIINELSES